MPTISRRSTNPRILNSKPELILQISKNAEDERGKGDNLESHAILAKVLVDPNDDS
jgi:hypothetical protein